MSIALPTLIGTRGESPDPSAQITGADLANAARAGDNLPPAQRMRAVALAYARLGVRVLPLWHVLDDGTCACGHPEHVPGGDRENDIGKHPITSKGVSEASSDGAAIRAWWWGHPYANVGIATGHLIDVIDIDDTDALSTVADLAAAGRVTPPLATAVTGRHGGGVHWLTPATGTKNRQNLLPDIDYRGRGGYIVAAPSRHRSGPRYTWGLVPLPTGDAERGHALPVVLPWEAPVTPSGDRRTAYANSALLIQATRLAATTSNRNGRAYRAAYSLAAMVNAGWITATETETALVAAYQQSGGTDTRDAARAVRNGLRTGAGNALRDLDDHEEEQSDRTPDETIQAVREWIGDEASRLSLRGGGRATTVALIEHVIGLVAQTGRLTHLLSVRDIRIAVGVGNGGAQGCLKRAEVAGVLRIVRHGSRGGGTAAVVRLTAPPGFGTSVDTCSEVSPVAPLGGVSTNVPNVGRPAGGHSIWAHARGTDRGLTHGDHELLYALPVDGATIRVAAWAEAAGVNRKTATRACSTAGRTLASLGLVTQPARGQVQATALGRRVAADVQGLSGSVAALDDLAASLGVHGRAEARVATIEAERDAHKVGLIPHIAERTLLGRPAAVRWPRLVLQRVHEGGASAWADVLADLDLTPGAPVVRRAVLDCARAIVAGRDVLPADRGTVLGWAGITVGAVERLLAPVMGDETPDEEGGRLARVAALIAGIGLATERTRVPVNPATGEVLDSEAAADVDADWITLAPTDREWAIRVTEVLLALDPLPSIADLTTRIAANTAAARHGTRVTMVDRAPSPGYQPALQRALRPVLRAA